MASANDNRAFSVEDAREVIREKYNLIIPDNDPLLMSVELHHYMLADYDQHHAKHLERMNSALDNQTLRDTLADVLADEVWHRTREIKSLKAGITTTKFLLIGIGFLNVAVFFAAYLMFRGF